MNAKVAVAFVVFTMFKEVDRVFFCTNFLTIQIEAYI